MSKRFGTNRVLRQVSFSFETGVLGIAGNNGSGKSTLLRCLAGLLRPDEGTVTWQAGDTTLSPNQIKPHLGYVAPYINLYHDLTVQENIKLVLELRKKEIAPSDHQLLAERLQLQLLQDKPFGDLSTGQQQRARLATVLAYAPGILILDEPGANLDERGRNAVSEILSEFRRDEKMVILASNNPAELELADRVISVN